MNSSQPTICTIASTNYLAYLRTVCQSFLEHHPLGSCHVLFIDEFSGKFNPASEPFRAYGTEEMDVPELRAMSFHYDAFEYSCSLKPYFARHLLRHHGLETLFYLDADTWVTGSFQAALSQLAECDALLTPHLDEPLPMDGLRPNDADMVLSGVYNMGFLGLRNTPNTIRLLDWWAEQLVTDCIIDHRNGLLGDQRFMDQAIQTFPDIQPFSNIAYNVAYWNLHSRALEQSDGDWQVNGAPMAMFHFSGYSPDLIVEEDLNVSMILFIALSFSLPVRTGLNRSFSDIPLEFFQQGSVLLAQARLIQKLWPPEPSSSKRLLTPPTLDRGMVAAE